MCDFVEEYPEAQDFTSPSFNLISATAALRCVGVDETETVSVVGVVCGQGVGLPCQLRSRKASVRDVMNSII
jgi:hypothetical protein